ncbi:MAG: AraC family transcriptional regulator [Lachnospiraceae bacterium]|nr:AraC family transcriptional regulator [Robinsoniella sp.]MDY3766034.1 AraC family transcriptional regulator [Lachnospiraceae bacterium]
MALSDSKTAVDLQGHELKKHGNAMFPVGCYRVFPAVDIIPWHWHNDMEVILVGQGEVEIGLENGAVRLYQGQGFFVNANVLHACKDINPPNCCLNSIVFHPRFIGGSPESVFWERYLNPLLCNTALKGVVFDKSQSWHQDVIRAIEIAWQSCASESFGYEFQMWNSLSKMILELVLHQPPHSTYPPTEKSLRDSERIKCMLQYIQNHLEEELTIEQIAKSAMIGKSECLRCFQNTIGTPPMHYVRQLRIQKASQLLKETDWKISEIGEKCGFLDMSYFAKSFHMEHGCTPGEYRRKWKEVSVLHPNTGKTKWSGIGRST